MARRNAAVARGVGHTHQIFAARADNAEVWDVEGKRYIDFAGGIAVLNTGHRHPEVIAAVKAQLELYTHTCFQVLAYEPYVALAEKLNALAPGDFRQEDAAAEQRRRGAGERGEDRPRPHRAAGGRSCFTGGYHGRTMMTLGMTGKVAPYKLGFGPFPGSVFHAQFPNALYGVSASMPPSPRWKASSRTTSRPRRWRPSSSSRCRAKVASTWRPPPSCSGCASCATSTASCSSPTRCRPAPAAPAPSSRWSRWAWPPTS